MKRLVLALLLLSPFSGLIEVGARSFSFTGGAARVPAETPQRKTRPRRVRGVPPENPELKPLPPDASNGAPYIRVVLAMDVASATIACDHEIVRFDEASRQPVQLGETQIHFRPVPARTDPLRIFRVQVAEVEDGRPTDWLIRRLRSQFGKDVMLKTNGGTRRQVIYLGRFGNKRDAEAFAGKLKRAGYRRARPVDEIARPVTLVEGRSPSDQLLLRVASQLTLASPDEVLAPLKFNGRAYRGRLVVRLNEQERLSIMNELPLEHYLWSVVPNELNPLVFSKLEALKAQAVAARTYAVLQKLTAGASKGYDLRAGTQDQVYTGVSAEQALSTRAVNETRGLILTYQGEPIEALYTSTCGGKTEDSEAVFDEARPYLRSVRCAPEVEWLTAHTIETKRSLQMERPIALLRVFGLLASDVTTEFLTSPASVEEVQKWLRAAALRLNRKVLTLPLGDEQVTRLAGFALVLVKLFYPPDTAAVLFTPADVEYILDFTDVEGLTPEARAAIALLVNDGILKASRVRQADGQAPLTRAMVLSAISRLLQRARALPLREGRARWLAQHEFVIEPQGEEPRPYRLADTAVFFKQVASETVAARQLSLIGEEKVWFHTNSTGRIDYLELIPHQGGVAYDHSSPVSHWDVRMTAAELTERLRGRGINVGPVVDVVVRERGTSFRVMTLEVMGTEGREELRRGAIRSALGLKENLFVIRREFDRQGRVVAFTFRGRGWGHGVGLCQVGAYGLAKEGLKFSDILKTYYTGVDVTRIY